MPAIFITIIAWIVGILAALYLGTSFGDSDYLVAILVGLGCAGVAFICWFHRYTLHIMLALSLFNLQFYTFGFNMNPDEIATIFGMSLLLIYIWQPEPVSLPEALHSRYFKLLKFALICWCSYTISHAIIHLLQGYLGHEPGIRNIIKSYYSHICPYLILLFICYQPQRLYITKRILYWVVWLCFFAILINAAMRFYQQLYGIRVQYSEDVIPEPFYIPYINLVENIYTLRLLGPLAGLLGMVILTSSAWKNWKITMYSMALIILLLGLFGSFVSGGRAAVITFFVFIFTVLALRKQYTLLITFLVSASILVGIINAFAREINNNAPYFITRSVQLVIFEKKEKAMGDIEGSSKWRNELHMRAFKEWLKTPKNIFFGRGFMGLEKEEDWYTGYLSQDYSEYMMDLSVRRIGTHAMITDLLLAYGIIGAIIYYAFLFLVLAYSWFVMRAKNVHEISRDIALFLVASSFVYIAVNTIAAGIMPTVFIWLLMTLVASLHSLNPSPESDSP